MKGYIMAVLGENRTNEIWQDKVESILWDPQFIPSPRGQEVREQLAGQYTVPMPAFLDLVDRKVNVNFMFAEAWWILSGSNRLEDLTPYMSAYANFSDDNVFLRGAYGPKVVDQLGYVVDCLEKDNDSRQAVISIWRERPGPSKDIPCTINMQFVIRDEQLYMLTNMRSNDIVLGFTYDVFTFSMVGRAVQLLLKERGVNVGLADLTVTAGSLHLYETHYEKAKKWIESTDRDEKIGMAVVQYANGKTFSDLLNNLKKGADEYGEAA